MTLCNDDFWPSKYYFLPQNTGPLEFMALFCFSAHKIVLLGHLAL